MDRITVVGIGAIGSVIAHRLQKAGFEPGLLASRRSAVQLRERGLRVREDGTTACSRPRVTDDARTLGVQDIVVVCLKEPSLRSCARDFAPLIGPDTIVVTMLNGVPWWFTRGLAALNGRTLAIIDPDGAVEAAIPADRCVGCVVYLASSVDADGVAVVGPPGRLIVGDPAPGHRRARTDRIAALLAASGFKVETTDDIRRATWVKLLGNVAVNPLSALTGATVSRLLDDPATDRLVRAMMAEAIAVATALGIHVGGDVASDVDSTIDERVAALRRLGGTKTSMLQDLEADRPLEIDAIVAAVAQLGAMMRVQTPFIDALLGMVRLRTSS